jgi:hypothetical protein
MEKHEHPNILYALLFTFALAVAVMGTLLWSVQLHATDWDDLDTRISALEVAEREK